ncbi:hypothetical protein DMN91_001067 [Ooceraea biroi]|uniref:Fibrillin-2 n=1 Tax=Ooceraea biroi TaxID=2015173 RepID=A0A3L8E3S0_OOCBI|nr:fibrillin-1 [Ooceraea biroi]RLU27266.1 hypothetical protein DMN91_001067 [Ooceraea biroi]
MSSLAVCLMLLSTVPAILGNCPLQALPWGALREERVLENGTLQLRYFCEPGRRLKGHKVATCTANGWDHPVPKCVLDSDKSNLQTTEKHFNVLANKKKNQKRLFVKAELNKTIVSQLDTTCLIEGSIQKFIKAPSIEHAHEARYAKRTNVRLPYNQFHVAIYSCMEGFVFLNLKNDRLFCSNGTWIGRHPKCVRKTEKVKHCAKHGKECQHVCEDTPTDIKCSCFDGFRAEGSSCIDIDECAEGTAKCTDICRNEPGTYHCECHHGFVLGNDRHSCQDVNECLSNNRHGPCQGICRNLKGSYECSCADIPGYKLAADNHTCEDIDECMLGNVNCSHQCYNVPGSAFCLCPSGYYLEDDWKTCLDINECQISNPCPNDTVCRNIVGSYKCVSKVRMEKVLRFEGTNVDEDRDDYEEIFTEEPNLLRKNPWSTHHVCRKGFKLKSVNGTSKCVDINECKLWKRRCQHKCVNEPGTYHCTCHSGYELKEDGRHCRDIDECTPGTHTCFHSCTNLVGSYECGCPPDTPLDKDCVPSNACEIANCSHICDLGRASYRCDCPSGYVMQDDKKTCKDIDECLENNECYKCINTPGSYRCICPPGARLAEDGFNCVYKLWDFAKSNCSLGLKYMSNGHCEDVDECLESEHGCSQLCINKYGSYRCDCEIGWILKNDGFTCIKFNHCFNSTCSHSCISTSLSYKCECPLGYILNEDGNTCKDVDECENIAMNDCSHDCINLKGSYSCSCPPGFKLGEDNRTCIVIIPYTCANSEGDDCTCPEGHTYLQEEHICKDIDECQDESRHNCSHFCINTSGSYYCECPSDLHMLADFKTCRQWDSFCVNEVGCSYSCKQDNDEVRCVCPTGYELIKYKKTCKDVNECDTGLHDCSHDCRNHDGGFTCHCPNYFILDKDNKTCLNMEHCIRSEFDCVRDCITFFDGYTHYCQCPYGYEPSSFDNTTCYKINYCDRDHDCDHKCISEFDDFRCQCFSGYELWTRDNKTCINILECELNNPCSPHRCINLDGQFMCVCSVGHPLTEDEETCEGYEDDCIQEDGGCSYLCAYTDMDFMCLCPNYEFADDDSTCKIDPCYIDNGGCSHFCHYDGNVTCTCPVDMILIEDDRLCVHKKSCLVNNGGCSDICTFVNDTSICDCSVGYRLSLQDNTTCWDINECSELRDICNQICINTPGSFKCSCRDGYAQMPYAPEICIDVNECEVIENGGCSHICVNTPGSYHCDCPVGYRLSPQDKITCKDINECVEQHVCDHTCINTPGSFKCSCWHGFVQSPNDPALCEDRDECEIENGGCSHTCMNVIGTYLCRCPEKYELTNDWKTCIWDGCKHNNGKCSHYCHPVLGPASVPGAIYCSCPRGYDLWHDGRTCKDIDECMEQHVCDHTCINNPGSYECRCRQGFRLVNGSTCVDIDECIEKAPCSKICINIPGSYYCTCPIGFKLQEDECVGK